MNRIKTAMLLATLTALLLWAGQALGGLLGILLTPIAAALVQTAISRSREFLADAEGARMTHNPLSLARALRKIEAWSHRGGLETASPATAHLFIINPFSGGVLREAWA
jgi:heat shock protein HtpX